MTREMQITVLTGFERWMLVILVAVKMGFQLQ